MKFTKLKYGNGLQQKVDHTLTDMQLANVYLDSPYYNGHCKLMCVSSPVHPVIIGNVVGNQGGDMPSRISERSKTERKE